MSSRTALDSVRGVTILLGPGLAKTQKPRLVVRLVRELYRLTPSGLESLLAAADVVSEGAPIDGVWCGSTSIDLPLPADASTAQLRALTHDPHLRVHVLRLARREASVRAPGPIETLRCEVSQRTERSLLRIVVDVEAVLGHARPRVADAPRTR